MSGPEPAWEAVLDALEEQVRRAESLATGKLGQLSPPLLSEPQVPLPAELALRARVLLARQQEAIVKMRRRRQTLIDEQRYLAR